jgi:hypothetical protein
MLGEGAQEGEGKDFDMPKIDLPKAYDFHAVERKLYAWWEKSGYFQPVTFGGGMEITNGLRVWSMTGWK